eukprot:767491-Hanusia_phi.AAC.6
MRVPVVLYPKHVYPSEGMTTHGHVYLPTPMAMSPSLGEICGVIGNKLKYNLRFRNFQEEI